MQAYSPLSSGAPAPGLWPESQFSLKTPTKNRVVSITENAREGAFGYTQGVPRALIADTFWSTDEDERNVK